MRRATEILGGLWELFLLGMKTRWRLRGPYWRWRYETAFGTDLDKMPSRWKRLCAVIEYGRWIHRMKRRHR